MSVSAVGATGTWNNRAVSARQNVQAGTSTGQESSGAAASGAAGGKRVDPVAAFTELTKGTVEQRLFRAWLGRNHLTREQYDALPADEKKKLAEAFRQELEDELKGGVKTGRVVDIAV